MAIIARRFAQSKPSLTINELSSRYDLPVNLVTMIVLRLRDIGLVNFVETPDHDISKHPVQPSIDVSTLSVGEVIRRLQESGDKDFIPHFQSNYAAIIEVSRKITGAMVREADNIPITSLHIASNDQK